jgi:ribonuclease HI
MSDPLASLAEHCKHKGTYVMPKPQPRPPRVDVVPAQTPPVATVAIAVSHDLGGAFRYRAVSAERTWSGQVDAPNKEAAIFDAIAAIRADAPEIDRVRFLVSLLATSPLWRHTCEIAGLLHGSSVEKPGVTDLPLMQAASARLAPPIEEVPQPEPPPCPPETPPPPPDLSPLTVATDGSVRGSVTGFGWLASDGQFEMLGFRHRRKQVGTKVVLISELRAIGDAVRKLRYRPLTLVSDSKCAIWMVTQWMNGDDVLPDGYSTERADGKPAGLVTAQRLIYAQRGRITPLWVKGHQGEPLNEGVDALARLARRYAAGPCDLTPAEYRRRTEGLAEAFSKEFKRLQEVGQLPLPASRRRDGCTARTRNPEVRSDANEDEP